VISWKVRAIITITHGKWWDIKIDGGIVNELEDKHDENGK